MKQVQRSCKHRHHSLPPSPVPPPPPYPPCKGIQDSLGFWIPRRGFRIQSTGFRILCQWDSGFLELYSGFQSPGFWIPQAKISWIRESGIPYMGRKSSCNEIDQLYFLFSHSGTFLLIYVNEYNIAVQAFALQGTVSDPSQWMEAIKKAQVSSTLSLQVPVVTKINFPLTISIRNQENRL